MDFVAVLDQVITLLRQRGRLTYRTLQLQFQLDDVHLEALKDELIKGQRLATDEDGAVLVWTGDPATPVSPARPASVPAPPPAASAAPEAERRQLTVLFCDLVDSTVLASQLDPEDLREVVRAYQDTCAKVIARFDGHIAQYLGDGLLVYFGYPLAHEDDAQRAVRAGLGILEALEQLNARLTQERRVQVAVRLGVDTGLVVVGDVGGGTRQEQLALGETPNLAARLQGLAAPNTLVISAATFPLLGGFFACQPLGTPLLKGLAQPLAVYRVLYESMARSRLEAAGSAGLTPLVGREQDIGVLRARWAQVTDGSGQVVLLSGEAGIGKSRLVQVLTDQVATEPQAWLTPCQCSPYHQHTALYPIIDLLERVALRFEREESPQQKLHKLEGFLVQYGLPLVEAVPLFATLLSLPLPDTYAPLTLSSEQQKQQTLHAVLTILLRIAAQQPVLFVMEDLHWVDPSTLELLTLLVDQGPTARILALLTCRPDFSPPWTGRSHLTQVTLHRLTPPQAAELIHRVAHHKTLPSEVVAQVVAKTDGVPLFVEELTKMVLEAGLLREREDRYELTGPLPALAIPATLQDSLMARLDRLSTVKAVAQLGATIGRTFAYTLLQAVAPLDAATLQQGLRQLVEGELVYQRGVPPQATYTFKHALIQDAAYQSLLKSTRQQYHQRIAQVLEAQFPETAETQPELLAQHYTQAGRGEQAIGYWQRAGQRATQRSAHVEAMHTLTKGLAVLETLPDTRTRCQHELTLQCALGAPLIATKGYAAPEVAHAYSRARALCQQMGETAPLLPVLYGLWAWYFVRAEFQSAHEIERQLFELSQHQHVPALRLMTHWMAGGRMYHAGDMVAGLAQLDQAILLYDPQQHQTHTALYGVDFGVFARCYASHALWLLGYPDHALTRGEEVLALAQALAHPFSLTMVFAYLAMLHQFRGERDAARTHAEAAIALCTEHGFGYYLAWGTLLQGWSLCEKAPGKDGLIHMRQGLTALQATGAGLRQPYYLSLLAEACRNAGEADEGVLLVTQALGETRTTREHWWEAELHRLRGALLLQHSVPDAQQAAACFHQALDVARHQQATSLELRAAISLSRLWQQQGKCAEAYELLAPIYGWFTEGFGTVDLQEAKALLEELAG